MSQDVPRVVRNDWSQLTVPDLGRWRPTLTVSVVIPAYNCQQSLDLTLASLTAQTYPADLLEVVVVDDGSEPPLELPKIRPENCRLIRVPDVSSDWGIANATNIGVLHSSGQVIHRLDADMVVFPEHIEALARWQHQAPYIVSLGAKRFVDITPAASAWPTPDEVAAAGEDGRVEQLFDTAATEPHGYIEKLIRETDQLRAGDHLIFRAHVGATVALRRELYDVAGGFDARLRRGSDTEFGYRLAQAGAVFVPEPAARSWHLGRSTMMRQAQALQRYSRPFLADLMPHPRWLRKAGGSAWAVPLVTVVMHVDGQPLEMVRAGVDALLRSEETDLRVLLVGPWETVREERRRLLDDPVLELRLIAATYRSDPRVRLVNRSPNSAFPSPYLLTLPVTAGLAPAAIRHLIETADRHQAGLVRVPLHDRDGVSVELWRTAALGRARWVRGEGEPLADVVAATHGSLTLSAADVGVVDLSQVPLNRLATGIRVVAGRNGRWMTGPVEVAGLRSLARAAALVARLAVERAWAWARRRLTGGRR